MGLNIKNERVHELARQAAALTGLSQTGAIEEALRRLLDEYGVDPARADLDRRRDLVHTIVAAYGADPGDDGRAVRTVEDLYDETGLPR